MPDPSIIPEGPEPILESLHGKLVITHHLMKRETSTTLAILLRYAVKLHTRCI
jgi:hypothetical protein